MICKNGVVPCETCGGKSFPVFRFPPKHPVPWQGSRLGLAFFALSFVQLGKREEVVVVCMHAQGTQNWIEK